jgi:hypothetical protein
LPAITIRVGIINVGCNLVWEGEMEQVTRNGILARVVGLIVFLAGVAILSLVFFRAHHLFSTPPPGFTANHAGQGLTTSGLSEAALTLVAQIGLLFIMTLVGSLMAGRGVQLYLGCPEQGKS